MGLPRKFMGHLAHESQKLKTRLLAGNHLIPLKNIKIEKPIFFVGVPGGGLTIITRILRRHEDLVYISGNSDFFAGDDEMCNESYVPDKLARWAKGNVYKNEWDSFFGYERGWLTGTKRFKDKYYCDENDYNSYLEYRLRYIIKKKIKNYAKDVKRARFVDKSQIFSLKIKLIKEIFPDAKIILVLRNPSAICSRVAGNDYLKNKHTKKLKNLPYEKRLSLACESWKNTIRIALNDLSEINDGYILRIEDFLRNPKEELENLMSFCELPLQTGLLPSEDDKIPLGSVSKDKWYPLKEDINSKYLKKISKKDKDLIEKTIGKDLLKKTGYSNN